MIRSYLLGNGVMTEVASLKVTSRKSERRGVKQPAISRPRTGKAHPGTVPCQIRFLNKTRATSSPGHPSV